MTTATDYDLVIVGGGTVGTLLALALQDSGLTIAVIEPKPFTAGQPHPGFDARSIALSHRSVSFLNALGLGESLAKVAAPIHSIKVSDQGHAGQARLDRDELGVEALGRVITLHDLGTLLRKPLGDAIQWHCPDHVSALTYGDEQVSITLHSGASLSSRLLVVADGAPSTTAELAGIKSEQDDYQQSALIANVRHQKTHHHRAFERFTVHGPLAMLPLTENTSALVWSVLRDEVDNLNAAADADLLRKLQREFGYELGRFIALSERASYPLRLVQAKRTQSHRTLVIGNAARMLHPIAGQGFNLGLRDVAVLADILNQDLNDCGEYALLKQYRERRQSDQDGTIGLTDTLVRSFSNDWLPAVVSRNLGLAMLQHCAPLKSRFARQAMGYE